MYNYPGNVQLKTTSLGCGRLSKYLIKLEKTKNIFFLSLIMVIKISHFIPSSHPSYVSAVGQAAGASVVFSGISL